MCVQVTTGTSPREYDENLVTASNYLRLIAAVILRGLVLARDDQTFFRGEERGGKYSRTGAAEVVGLSLYQYQ